MKNSGIKRFISFALSCMLFGTSFVVQAVDNNESSGQEIKDSFNDPQGRVMVASHRGFWKEHPENSLSSLQGCIDLHVDMAELDIRQTVDGEFILMHDETVDRTTNGSGRVDEMTLEQISNLRLRDGMGGPNAQITTEKVPTLREILLLAKDKIMINMDIKSFGLYDAIYNLLVETDTVDYAMFKGTYTYDQVVAGTQTLGDWISSKTPNPIYVIGSSLTSEASLMTYVEPFVAAQATKMIEINFSSDSSYVFSNEFMQYTSDKMRVFANPIGATLSGGRTDSPAGWSSLIAKGVDVLQTDDPERLVSYLDTLSNDRDAYQKIEAEVYNGYAGLKDGPCSDLGYYLKPIQNGDISTYENINFGTSKANTVFFNLASVNSQSSISMYLDSISSTPIKTIEVSNTGDVQEFKTFAFPVSNITGKHTVILKFNNTNDELPLVNWFRFSQSAPVIQEIPPIPIFTYTMLAPTLPSMIETVLTDGELLSVPVVWERIVPEQYQQSGTFAVNGTVAGTQIQATANVTVEVLQTGIPQEGIKTWFKADNGVLKDVSNNVTAWNDSSPNNKNAIQADLKSQPQYVVNKLGRPTIRFDGVDDFMQFADVDLNGLNNISIVVVSSNHVQPPISGEITKAEVSAALMFQEEGGSWGKIYLCPSQEYVSARFGSGQTNNRGLFYTRQKSVGEQFNWCIATKDGLDEKIYSNGALLESKYNPLGTITANNASTGWIGQGKNTTFFDGDISEIIIYDRTISQAEMYQLNSYLSQKYSSNPESVSPVTVKTLTGVAPILPKTVDVIYTDGTKALYAVQWDSISSANYQSAGNFEVSGTIDGLSITATATIQVLQKEALPANGMQLWIRSDIGVIADNSFVTQSIQDFSGKNNPVTQSNKTYAPKLLTAGLPYPVIRFDGIDDFMGFSGVQLKSKTGVTIITVSANLKQGNVYAYWDSATAPLVYMTSPTQSGLMFVSPFQTNYAFRLGLDSWNPSFDASGRGMIKTRTHPLGQQMTTSIFMRNKKEDIIYVNGAEDLRVTNSTYSGTATNVNDIGFIGKGGNISNGVPHFNGDLAEIIIYDRTLTEEERLTVQGYLDEKYASVIIQAENVVVETTQGVAPIMPKTTEITYQDGRKIQGGVTWGPILESQYTSQAGTFTVMGQISNSTLTCTATITVTPYNAALPPSDSLITWLKADSGVVQDSNGNVQSWVNQIGGNASQSVVSAMPKYQQLNANGKPCLNFDGVNDFMSLNNVNINDKQGITMVVVSRNSALPADVDFQTTINKNPELSAALFLEETSMNSRTYFTSFKDRINFRMASGWGGNAGQIYAKPSVDNNFNYVVASNNQGNENIYYNGVKVVDTYNRLAQSTRFSSNILWIGKGKWSQTFAGDIAEILIYDRGLTELEITRLNAYLSQKYSL